jgi:hypothetical protein
MNFMHADAEIKNSRFPYTATKLSSATMDRETFFCVPCRTRKHRTTKYRLHATFVPPKAIVVNPFVTPGDTTLQRAGPGSWPGAHIS